MISDFARAALLSGPTPLEPLLRLSDELQIELWVKRDDLAGVSLGGNKSRQLEYYLGAAVAASADTVLITGAVQSNFVRTAAASAAKLGLRTIVQLEDRVPDMDETYANSGNVLLSRMLGAEVMRYAVGEDETGADKALHQRAAELQAEGHSTYVIPLGENNPPLGALGYMRAASEICDQDAGFDTMVLGSGSGLSHIGLLAGLRSIGHSADVIGSCVRRDSAEQTARLGRVLEKLHLLIGQDTGTTPQDIHVWDGALAPGYGQIGPRALEAMRMMARREGLMLDPVYTGKAFAAIPGLVASGDIPKGSRVLFVHTGGLPGLFAYEPGLSAAFA